MKKSIVVTFFILLILVNRCIFAQGYFVGSTRTYLNEDNFKTNIQEKVPEYNGSYIAVSETYESNYQFLVQNDADLLTIKIIAGATSDGGDNWKLDTTVYRNISVYGGRFKISDLSSNFGNMNFRFVTVTYVLEGKKVSSEGLVMEEYKMFTESEKQ